jgi:hypothetical protein
MSAKVAVARRDRASLEFNMKRKPIPSLDLDAFSGPFRTESDRACAVLGAALLDARLERLYNRRLREFKDELLSGNGALRSFSARIKVARALNWIAEDVGFDLGQVRSIRNVFAHDADHELSFGNESIAAKCRTLKVANVLIDANKHAASIPHPKFSQQVIRAMGAILEPPRRRFEITVEMLAQYIDELPGDSSDYNGPNLQAELWALGSKVNIKISATGIVGSSATDAERG